MRNFKMILAKLRPTLLACLVVLVAAGCASVNLGDIDETESDRDDMPGPGILANEDGETTLQWSTNANSSGEISAQAVTEVETDKTATGIEPNQTSATATQPTPVPTMDEEAEFEEFKEWHRLRTEDANSPEYQEFLLWLKYQQFKN